DAAAHRKPRNPQSCFLSAGCRRPIRRLGSQSLPRSRPRRLPPIWPKPDTQTSNQLPAHLAKGLAYTNSPNTTPQRRSEMGRAGPRKVSVLFDCWSFGLARSRILSARSGGKAWSRTSALMETLWRFSEEFLRVVFFNRTHSRWLFDRGRPPVRPMTRCFANFLDVR